MGKNTNKPVHKSAMPRADAGESNTSEGQMPMSKEMEEAQLERLLNPVERPSWEQFKEQQRLKGEMEGKEARAEVEARLKRDPSAWALDATSPAAAVANMEMLDAIYTKSGLGLRG